MSFHDSVPGPALSTGVPLFAMKPTSPLRQTLLMTALPLRHRDLKEQPAASLLA